MIWLSITERGKRCPPSKAGRINGEPTQTIKEAPKVKNIPLVLCKGGNGAEEMMQAGSKSKQMPTSLHLLPSCLSNANSLLENNTNSPDLLLSA